jgi:hypothetical protein
MPRQPVEMVLLQRGEVKNKRSLERLASALGDDAAGTQPDETTGVFEIEIEADDLDGAMQRVWNAVAASATIDNIVFLEQPDMPEQWRHLAGRPRRGQAD